MRFRVLTTSLFLLAALVAVLGGASISAAQQTNASVSAVTVGDYQRAEKFLPWCRTRCELRG